MVIIPMRHKFHHRWLATQSCWTALHFFVYPNVFESWNTHSISDISVNIKLSTEEKLNNISFHTVPVWSEQAPA